MGQTPTTINVPIIAETSAQLLADPKLMAAELKKMTPEVAIACEMEATNKAELKAVYIRLKDFSTLAKDMDKARTGIATTVRRGVDAHYLPLIELYKKAVEHLEGVRDAWAAKENAALAKQQEIANAKAKRSLAAQTAALAQGKEKRTEIVPVEVYRPPVAAFERKTIYRLEHKLKDLDAVPDEFITRLLDRGAVQKTLREFEAEVPKDRRGFAEIPDLIPGVEITWKTINL